MLFYIFIFISYPEVVYRIKNVPLWYKQNHQIDRKTLGLNLTIIIKCWCHNQRNDSLTHLQCVRMLIFSAFCKNKIIYWLISIVYLIFHIYAKYILFLLTVNIKQLWMYSFIDFISNEIANFPMLNHSSKTTYFSDDSLWLNHWFLYKSNFFGNSCVMIM